MAVKKNTRTFEDMSLSEMTEAERLEYIESLEDDRDFVVSELEELMKELAKLTGRRSLKRRRFKLGRAPNDRRS